MKKILILTNNMNGGGAEQVLLTLLRNIPPDHYDINLCLVYREGTLLNQLPSTLKVSALFDERNPQTEKTIRTDTGHLYQVAATEKYDVEIAFLEGNAVKILSHSTNREALKIAWVHIDLSREHYTAPIFGDIERERLAFSCFDRIFCVSESVRLGLASLFGMTLMDKSTVVYNPLDAQRIKRLANEADIPKQCLTFCAVGRLSKQKGFDRLLDASDDLLAEGFQFDVWLLGTGRLQDELQQRCANSQLADHVHFMGFQDNPYPYIKCADAFVSSSLVEGLPMVLGEALILNTPIIATSCGGQVEALQNGRYGLIVDNSTEGVYTGMKAFLEGKYTGQEIRFAGPECYLPYQLDKYIHRIMDLIESR